MEINKQLFEDVLSGKLKGTFITRNRCKICSDMICRNTDNFYFDEYKKDCYPYMHVKNHAKTYAVSGKINELYTSYFDIVDFIPEINMETKELKITIPEGQEIDWQESAKQEKIIFKKKDSKPRSWEEYCKNYKGTSFFINTCGTILPSHTDVGWNSELAKNLVPSKELAEAFLAMMQLMSLRQAWIGDWKPDWKNSTETKYCLCQSENVIKVYDFCTAYRVLSFPTKEMAEDFMNCFKDLLEKAKPLI